MLTTTKRLIRNAGACKERYGAAVKKYGRRYKDDDPIPLTTVLDLCGLEDALWCLRAVTPEQEAERDRLALLFACACVRRTPITNGGVVYDIFSQHGRYAVDVAERYAVGKATSDELAAARAAARAAAWDDAWYAAWDAARGAAWDAALAAALGAAWDDAWDAAWATQQKLFIEFFGDEK